MTLRLCFEKAGDLKNITEYARLMQALISIYLFICLFVYSSRAFGKILQFFI